MIDIDECYKKLERRYTNLFRTTGETENSFFQHVGKIYNMDLNYVGKAGDKFYAELERIMLRQKKHGFEQNKKSELEKLQEKGIDKT